MRRDPQHHGHESGLHEQNTVAAVVATERSWEERDDELVVRLRLRRWNVDD